MITMYTILHISNDEIINCWTEEEDGRNYPCLFETLPAAGEELNDHYLSLSEAYISGAMTEFYAENFIAIALPGLHPETGEKDYYLPDYSIWLSEVMSLFN